MKKPCEIRCTGSLISQEKVRAEAQQGWIKGVNSNSLTTSTDPGNDGGTTGSNQNFARDAFGYTLNYFSGDYQAIDPNKSLSANNFIASTNSFTNLATDAPNLYNGNISSMVTTIKDPTTGDVLPQFTMYKYDQLNRLRNMKAFADFSFSNNEWNYSSYDGRYQNDFTYDANGNIETALAKNANGDVIDNQVYNYYKPGNNKHNNRLYSISDDASITSGKDLPSGQIAFDAADLLNNNYRYNELGELVYDKQMGIDEITWGNNGKIKSVTHSEASGKYNLKFDYNHTGKRIAKHVYNQNNTLLRSEYYTRDASDNVMAVYRLEVDEQNQEVSFRLKERHIYGSSMLGIDRQEVELIEPISGGNTQSHIVGLKSYTGSNHLGNVLTTFSDKKLPVDENSDGIIDYYKADIVTSSDYAPFGGLLTERSFNSENYPNSFNGKRDDTELGDWQDYGMRMYIPYQRRFPSPDPIIVYKQKYPELSTYQFASNTPIMAIDLDGLEMTAAIINDEYTGHIYGAQVPVGDVKEKKVLADVAGIISGTLFTVYGGPPGWILGPTTVGLSTAKLIGHLNEQTFNQSKVDKAPSSFTGAFLGAGNEAVGGDFSKGASWGDLIQGAYELKAGFPIKNNIDIIGQTATTYGLLSSSSQLLNNNKDVSTSSPISSLNVWKPNNQISKTKSKDPCNLNSSNHDEISKSVSSGLTKPFNFTRTVTQIPYKQK